MGAIACHNSGEFINSLKVFFVVCRDGSLSVKMTASIVNVHSQTQQAYRTTIWAEFFHSAPHVNITFHQVREPISIYWTKNNNIGWKPFNRDMGVTGRNGRDGLIP